jgi:DNA-directed RNA polymerase subunit RPC12/RpoP
MKDSRQHSTKYFCEQCGKELESSTPPVTGKELESSTPPVTFWVYAESHYFCCQKCKGRWLQGISSEPENSDTDYRIQKAK